MSAFHRNLLGLLRISSMRNRFLHIVRFCSDNSLRKGRSVVLSYSSSASCCNHYNSQYERWYSSILISSSPVIRRVLSPLVIFLFLLFRHIGFAVHLEFAPCRFHAQQDGQRIDAAFVVCTHLWLPVLPHFKQRRFSLIFSVHAYAAVLLFRLPPMTSPVCSSSSSQRNLPLPLFLH